MPAGENHDGKRGRHAGITVNAAIPGFVKTNFNDGAHGGMAAMIRLSVKLIGISAAKGADTPLWVATAPELTGRDRQGLREAQGEGGEIHRPGADRRARAGL
jgi:NAD(P)-dependent dehydrogenase (short-subunit alcohol dehydrogenase family)